MQPKRPTLTAGEIAQILFADLVGDSAACVSGAEVIDRADDAQLSFVGDSRNLKRIAKSRSRVIIVPSDVADDLQAWSDRTFILADEPETAFLTILALLIPPRARAAMGISPQAVVAASASIGGNTNIHPLAVIGQDVSIGHNCDIHSGVVIGDGCRIGDGVVIYPNTVLYHDIIVGDHCIIHACCAIGADGFGYRQVAGKHLRLPHFGIVRICDDVEVGAGTTIDRAKVGETVIGRGTKIDDQVMIAHNCQVGEHNLIVAQVGFAGSVSTGSYVVCAGQAGIADHVHLHDGAVVGAQSGVHRDLPGGQAYLGSPAAPVAETTRQLIALRRLPALRDTLRDLEKEVAQLQKSLASGQSQAPPFDERAAA